MATEAKTCGVHAITTAGAGGEGTATAETPTVAAVFPVCSAVIGDGTESEGEEYVAPFNVEHLLWDCLLDGPGVDAPVRTQALIDSGSYAVIIDSKMVERLALRRRKLPTPLEVNLAMGGGASKLTMTEWVKIAPASLNMSWKS